MKKKDKNKKMKMLAGILLVLVILASAIYFYQREGILFSPPTQSFQGELQIAVADDFENGIATYFYYLQTETERYELIFDSNPPLGRSGKIIEVTGKLKRDGKIQVSDLSILQEPEPLIANEENLGEQKTVVILVNFRDNQDEPITLEEAEQYVFDENYQFSLNSFVKENSYEKAFVTGDVYGWYTIEMDSETCEDSNEVLNLAIIESDPDINFTNYERIIIVNPECPTSWAGVGTFGKGMTVSTDEGVKRVSVSWIIWLNRDKKYNLGTIKHEFGHNLDLRHANYYDCGNEVAMDNCESFEYGDIFDTMGWSGSGAHFSALNKELIGWIEDTFSISQPGIYKIALLEINTNNIRSYKISPAEYAWTQKEEEYTSENIYIEYRRPILLDSNLENIDGVFLRLDSDARKTNLLDLSPVEERRGSVILREGRYFFLEQAGMFLTVQELTDEYAEIELSFSIPLLELPDKSFKRSEIHESVISQPLYYDDEGNPVYAKQDAHKILETLTTPDF